MPPPCADVGAFLDRLKRALHTIECRELGPEAAEQRFGRFADVSEGHVFLSLDSDRLLARHPEHEELRELVRAVRERGPAVNVTLTSPST
ncbi:hypothetical protein SMD44_p10052 (plasmid) [Streptomyces alboflavus]|uniref:Uncharacterized protein n=2 Tax=Streptomyces alboflavus TaxID=67267 RepID=A0A291W4I2_9ACTN|nr:hypothetical protein SMD44_p10052 [Streptomyces alboflavus]